MHKFFCLILNFFLFFFENKLRFWLGINFQKVIYWGVDVRLNNRMTRILFDHDQAAWALKIFFKITFIKAIITLLNRNFIVVTIRIWVFFGHARWVAEAVIHFKYQILFIIQLFICQKSVLFSLLTFQPKYFIIATFIEIIYYVLDATFCYSPVLSHDSFNLFHSGLTNFNTLFFIRLIILKFIFNIILSESIVYFEIVIH